MAFYHAVFLLILVIQVSPFFLFAQTDYPLVNFKYFGHLQLDAEHTRSKLTGVTEKTVYGNIGEQDLFTTAQISQRISFLGEVVVRPDLKSSSTFSPSIERAQVKFDYFRNHSFLIGKFHTPVNYWNDIYHHGRLFFPVVDRPLSFSYLVPLHTTGVRFQAQNLGSLRFGYDAVIGNGISSSDIKDVDLNKSVTLAAHIKPFDRFRVGVSYYYDLIKGNTAGVHSGHTTIAQTSMNAIYKGNIEFQLMSFSAAWFGEKFEFLHEFAFNRNKTDSLGVAESVSAFVYGGYRLGKWVPFLVTDYLDISNRDLHVSPVSLLRLIVGCRYEFNPNCNLKIIAERLSAPGSFSAHHVHSVTQPEIYELKLQFAYGF